MRPLPPSACSTHRRSLQRHLPALPSRSSNGRLLKVVPAASRRTEVVEMVVLLQAQQGMPEEVAEELIGELWSLQYRSPGVLTASGGTTQYPSPSPGGGSTSGSSSTSLGAPSSPPGVQELQPLLLDNTHAVHFRFASLPAAKALLRSPLLQAAAAGKSVALVGAAVASGGAAQATASSGSTTHSSSATTDGDSSPFTRSTVLAFSGTIESDVDALFRRTEDYATGQDLLLVMRGTLPVQQDPEGPSSQPQASSPAQSVPAPVAEFLKQLGLLAQSSIAGAVQVSCGPVAVVKPLASGSSSNSGADGSMQSDNLFALLARFPTMRQLQAFRTSQPVAALWQQRRVLLESGGSSGTTQGAAPVLPLYAEAEVVISAQPSHSSREGLGR